MIQGVGYTNDGLVWIQIKIDINRQPHSGTMMLTMDQANAFIKLLGEAVELAEKSNVRDSSNTH